MNGKSIEQIIKENEEKIKRKKEKIKDIIVQEKYYNFETKDYMTSKQTEKVEPDSQQKNESKETKQESKVINYSNDSSNSPKQKLNNAIKKEIIIKEEIEKPDKFFEEEIKKEKQNLKLFEQRKDKIESQKNSVNSSKIKNREKVIISDIDIYNNTIPIQNKSRISNSSRPYMENKKNACISTQNTCTNNKLQKNSKKLKSTYTYYTAKTQPNSGAGKDDQLYNINSHLLTSKNSDNYNNTVPIKNKSRISNSSRPYIENKKNICISIPNTCINSLGFTNIKNDYKNKLKTNSKKLKSTYTCCTVNTQPNSRAEKLYNINSHLYTNKNSDHYRIQGNEAYYKSIIFNIINYLFIYIIIIALTYFKSRIMQKKYKGKTDPVQIFHLLNKGWKTYSILTKYENY